MAARTRLRPLGDRALGLVLASVVLGLYSSSLRLGLIWDDPQWLGRVANARGMVALHALPGYGFFRPMTVTMHGLFVAGDGRVHDFALHATQVAWHLIATCLVFSLARRWLPTRAGAGFAAGLFAVLPFAQQSVAWALAHQPAALVFTLLSLSLWAKRDLGQSWLAAGSLLTYALALGLHEAAAPLAFAFWLSSVGLHQPSIRAADTEGGLSFVRIMRSVPPHVLMAAIFVLYRFSLPLDDGHLDLSDFDIRSLGMLLQPVAWPITRVLAYWPPIERVARMEAESVTAIVVVFASLATWLMLAVVLARMQRFGLALWASVWITVSIAPAWVGLSWSYARHGSRLGYITAVGVVLLWGALAGALLSNKRHPVTRAATTLACATLLLVCVNDTRTLNRMHHAGAAIVDEATSSLMEGDALFINLPDRLVPRRPPYPLGDWDLIALPIALEVADFARTRHGHDASIGTEASLHVAQHGHDQRATLPWWVDHRGMDASPLDILEAAADGRQVWVTDWLNELNPTTELAGWLATRDPSPPTSAHAPQRDPKWPPPTSISAVANEITSFIFHPSSFILHPSEILLHPSEILLPNSSFILLDSAFSAAAPDSHMARLWLKWSGLYGDQVDKEATFFVHQIDAAGRLMETFDGDAWRGLLPLTMFPDANFAVIDVRGIPMVTETDGVRFDVGVYERPSSRWAASTYVVGNAADVTNIPGTEPMISDGAQKTITDAATLMFQVPDVESIRRPP